MLGKLSILGPGLLGGSIGLAARHRKVAKRVVIWGRRPDAVDQAYKLGAADEAVTDLAKAVANAELVVLATPIGAMQALAEQMRPSLPKGCVVTDVGSVKYTDRDRTCPTRYKATPVSSGFPSNGGLPEQSGHRRRQA